MLSYLRDAASDSAAEAWAHVRALPHGPDAPIRYVEWIQGLHPAWALLVAALCVAAASFSWRRPHRLALLLALVVFWSLPLFSGGRATLRSVPKLSPAAVPVCVLESALRGAIWDKSRLPLVRSCSAREEARASLSGLTKA